MREYMYKCTANWKFIGLWIFLCWIYISHPPKWKKKLKIHVLCGTSIVLTQMGMSESYFFFIKSEIMENCV